MSDLDDNSSKGRRDFLKSVAVAAEASRGLQAEQAAQEPAKEAHKSSNATPAGRGNPDSAFEYPRTFRGRQLSMIAFPLGGVGAGAVSLGGRGQLRDWEIFNRPDK